MNEEVFGPVAAISVFENNGEAIAPANSTLYGFGASVWTKNLDTMIRMSLQPECGMGKDLSRYWIGEFVRIKHVNINSGTEKTRPWWFPYGGR